MQGIVYVCVTNDLATDARVARTCGVLHHLGYRIVLIGRVLHNSLPLNTPYKVRRFKLWFNKGFLFYAEYNVRLFYYLLLAKRGFVFSNDLDTLLPCYLISKIKGVGIVYDSHEYFTEVPEIQGRPLVKKVWTAIERFCVPKLRHCITINQSIASIYTKLYNVPFTVVRNIGNTPKKPQPADLSIHKINPNHKVLIMQGAGINVNRGAEELVQAMLHLPNFHLLIIGGGDVFETLKTMRVELGLEDRITILPKMPRAELLTYTAAAHLGLSLDNDTNLNYRYSLPNKVFDYIHCRIPVLCSNLPELKHIVETYNVGAVALSLKPEDIARAIDTIFTNPTVYQTYKANTFAAAAVLNWATERQQLQTLIKQAF